MPKLALISPTTLFLTTTIKHLSNKSKGIAIIFRRKKGRETSMPSTIRRTCRTTLRLSTPPHEQHPAPGVLRYPPTTQPAEQSAGDQELRRNTYMTPDP